MKLPGLRSRRLCVLAGLVLVAVGTAAASGPRMKRDLVVFSRSDGSARAGVPRVLTFGEFASSAVYAVLPDGRGGWFVGGSWKRIGTLNCPHLAHVLASRRVDPRFCPRPDNIVFALLRSGERLYVGGQFARIGGTRRKYLAAVDTGTGVVSDWDPQLDQKEPIDDRGTPIPGGVIAILRSGTSLYAWGQFDRAAGERRLGLVRIDSRDASPDAWSAQGEYQQSSPRNAPIALGTNQIYIRSDSGDSIDVIDTTSGTVKNWRLALGDTATSLIHALALRGRTLYVGGVFSRVRGRPRQGLATLDAQTGALRGRTPPVNGGEYGEVNVLTISGSTLFFGGSFERVGKQPRRSLAALDLPSNKLRPWSPIGPEVAFGYVAAIAATQKDVAVGCGHCE